MADVLQSIAYECDNQREIRDNDGNCINGEEAGQLMPDGEGEAGRDAPVVVSDLEMLKKLEQLAEEVREVRSDLQGLSDLFTRRLLDDRQKDGLIRNLEERASFAVIEPFISDLILLLDRVEKAEDDFSQSVAEELLDILERRDVRRIEVGRTFDPKLHKAVSVIKKPNATCVEVIGISRCGYLLGEKVIRPAEVVVQVPLRVQENDAKATE